MISFTVETVRLEKMQITKDAFVAYLCVCVMHMMSQHIRFLRKYVSGSTKAYNNTTRDMSLLHFILTLL